jgi:hypothetical protein
MIVRRKISEIVTNHLIDKNLRTLIVEGPFDKRVFVNMYINNKRDFQILSSDQVEIIEHDVECIDDGAKRICLLAAKFLYENGPIAHAKSLVDADFDYIHGAKFKFSPQILVTEFSSIEGYAFSIESLNRLVDIIFKDEISSDLYCESIDDCNFLFALRYHLKLQHIKYIGINNSFDKVSHRVDRQKMMLKHQISKSDCDSIDSSYNDLCKKSLKLRALHRDDFYVTLWHRARKSSLTKGKSTCDDFVLAIQAGLAQSGVPTGRLKSGLDALIK